MHYGWTQSAEDIKALIQKLQTTSSPNQKVELIIQLCDQFSLLNQGDSIKKYIQIAVPLANTIQNESAKAWVDHYLASTLVRTYPDSSYQLNNRSFTYFTKKNDQKGLLKTNHAFGVYQYYHGKPAKERAYYYEALKDWRDRESGLPPLRSDWLRTARVFMRNDAKHGKLVLQKEMTFEKQAPLPSQHPLIINNEKYRRT